MIVALLSVMAANAAKLSFDVTVSVDRDKVGKKKVDQQAMELACRLTGLTYRAVGA